ncbi:hypothetical protein COOONC_18812 [Cooperia oncophora]
MVSEFAVEETQKGFELARIIDFQVTGSFFGCAAEDLTRLLITTLSGHDRRKNWENLLKEFYGYLTTYCKKTELPYSLEQLKEAYRRFFPFAGTILLPIIDSVAKIGARKIADNEQVAIQETLGEKTQALFEGLVVLREKES